jgi:tripartite-type tricarboxylate transporter receptor subunit TctC
MILKLLQALRGTALALAATGALAQPAFPDRPVKIVVGSDAGSAPDVLARSLGREMESLLKQPVIIENRSGAAGTVGATAVSLAAADGTTLLMGTVANIALAPSFYPIKYKPTVSFTPVAMVASVPLVLVSSAAYGAPTMAQLSEKLRSGGREAAYASPGIGGPQHLAGVLLEKELSIKMVHVPFKSGGAALNAVASGDAQLGFAGIPAAIALLQTKRIVPMFVTTPRRSSALPDVPSATEVGLPAFEVDNWHALFAPAGLPAEARATLEKAVQTALASAAVKAQFARLGAEPAFSSGADLGVHVANEVQRWAKVAQSAGLDAKR